jgi:hypothetical protein
MSTVHIRSRFSCVYEGHLVPQYGENTKYFKKETAIKLVKVYSSVNYKLMYNIKVILPQPQQEETILK